MNDSYQINYFNPEIRISQAWCDYTHTYLAVSKWVSLKK